MHQINQEDGLPGRPYKEGYLKKQINSIFDIWNTRYFYLDNTNFAYFYDEKTDKPRQVINLEGCVIDGVWRNGELHTFTVRSLIDDDIFYYLGAFSAGEAEDWMRNLKAALRHVELEKLAKEMQDKNDDYVNLQESNQKDERYMEINDRKSFKSYKSDQDYYEEEDEVRNLQEAEWLEYLAKPTPEIMTNLPPQLDQAYNEFRRLLKDTSMSYNLVKSENYLNICRHEQDPKYWIYKSSFFIKGEFYDIVKVLNSDKYENLWNLYLTELKQTKKFAENIQVFDAHYELVLYNFIVAFKSFYITQAWIDRKKFNMIRSSLAPATTNYRENILTFDLPLEMLGVRVRQLNCSYPKSRMTVIIKLRRKNFLFDELIHKFIKKYLIAFTILRDELEQLVEKIGQVQPITEPRESTRNSSARMANAMRMNRPVSSSSPTRVREQKPNDIPAIAIKPQTPSILNPNTPEERKALEELKKRLAFEGINLPDILMRRFLMSREYVVEDAVANITDYLLWLEEMKFHEFRWDDPEMFSHYLQARIVKLIGHDRQGRPIIYVRVKNYLPAKTPEDLFRKHIFSFMRTVTEEMKPGVEQYNFIADLTDLSKENVSFGQFKTAAKALMRNFPQYNHKMYVVNGGFLVKMLYNTIKPILRERHKKKIVFCNTDKGEAYGLLKQEMDDDVIPVHLGGKNLNY